MGDFWTSHIRLKELGKGSYGSALLYRAKSSGKDYVVKEVDVSRMSRKDAAIAEQEAKILLALDHPNIVACHSAWIEQGKLFILMEYCSGGDLQRTIASQKGDLVPEQTILSWLVQMTLALKHVHDRKILHRDFKTANVFLSDEGLLKVGDFGVSKVLSSTAALAKTAIGTPYYISPEICMNRPYNAKTDIWSLGCVLYEMLTLRHAFEAPSMSKLIEKIVNGRYAPISARYSRDMRDLLGSLLSVPVRSRPSAAAILRQPLVRQHIERMMADCAVQEGAPQPLVAQVLQEVLPGPSAVLPGPGRATQEGGRPRSSQGRQAQQPTPPQRSGQGSAPRKPRPSTVAAQQAHVQGPSPTPQSRASEGGAPMLRFKDEAVHRGALPQAAAAMAAAPPQRRQSYDSRRQSHDGMQQSHDGRPAREQQSPNVAEVQMGKATATKAGAASAGEARGAPFAQRRQVSVSNDQEAVALRSQPASPHSHVQQPVSGLVRQRSYSADGGYAAAAHQQRGPPKRGSQLKARTSDEGAQWAMNAAARRRPPLSPLSQPRDGPVSQNRAALPPTAEGPRLSPVDQMVEIPLDEGASQKVAVVRQEPAETGRVTKPRPHAAAPDSQSRRLTGAEAPLEALKLQRLRQLVRRAELSRDPPEGQNRQSETGVIPRVHRTAPSEPALPSMQSTAQAAKLQTPKAVRISGRVMQRGRAPLRQRSYSADAVATLVSKASLLSGRWLDDLGPEPSSAKPRGNATPAFTAKERQRAFVEMQTSARANRLRAQAISSADSCSGQGLAMAPLPRTSSKSRKQQQGNGSLNRPPPLNARIRSLPEMPTSQREAAAAAFHSQISGVSSEYALDEVAESKFVVP